MNIMHKFTKDQVGDILQRLYAEFHFDMTCICGFGWIFQMNGLKKLPIESKVDITNIADALSGFAYEVSKSFPDSDFATWYKSIEQ